MCSTITKIKGAVIMWFMLIIWGVVVVALIATIILLTGKGSMLVSGFNTKSVEEKSQYDLKKVSQQTGITMTLIDIGLILLAFYMQFRVVPAILSNTINNYGTEITIVALVICAYIIIIGIAAAIRGFKHCKKR